MWVEFVVGSLLCSERFFYAYSGFPLSSKTNISKFQFDPGMHGHFWTSSCELLGASWVNKLHLHFFFLQPSKLKRPVSCKPACFVVIAFTSIIDNQHITKKVYVYENRQNLRKQAKIQNFNHTERVSIIEKEAMQFNFGIPSGVINWTLCSKPQWCPLPSRKTDSGRFFRVEQFQEPFVLLPGPTGYFGGVFFLHAKTSLRAKSFVWKWIPPTCSI